MSHNHPPQQSIAIPVFSWLVLLISPLLLSAMRFPLWPRMDTPIAHQALYVMAVTQFAATSLLFPWLMRDARVSGLVILSCPPLLLLAGWLSDSTSSRIIYVSVGIVIWTTALLLTNRNAVTVHTQLIAVALISTAAIGGLILLYLFMEFSDYEAPPLRGTLWSIPGLLLFVLNLLWMGVVRLRG